MWNEVWCAVPKMWFDVKYSWDVECITCCHCISHLIASLPHFTLHHSTSNTISDIPNHTTFHITPFHITGYKPYFTSCITAYYYIHHTTPSFDIASPHFTPHLTLHITFSITPYLANILHRTLYSITATLWWIRHNIPHLALQHIPHQRKFHTTLFHITPCEVWSGGIELCGMIWDVVWCAEAEMWFDVKYCSAVVVRCGSITNCHCISHIIITTTFYIAHQTPSLTLFQTTPHSTSRHHSSPYRTTSATLHSISHYVPHNATFHALHATFRITSYIGHIMHRPTTSHITPHFTQHCTAFHMLHILHNCMSTTSDRDYTQSPIPHHTATVHISHHSTSTTILGCHHSVTTFHIAPPPLPRTALSSPHFTSFHIAQRSTFHATAHSPIYIAPPLSITPFHSESNSMWSVSCSFIHIQPFIPHIKQHKNGGEKMQLHS